MEIVGLNVKNKSCGEGVIVKHQKGASGQEYVFVEFNRLKDPKQFQYPEAFENYLTCEKSVHDAIMELLSKKRFAAQANLPNVSKKENRVINFFEDSTPRTVYVYTQHCVCVKCSRDKRRNFEDVAIIVPVLKRLRKAKVLASLCKNCDKIYVRKTELLNVEKKVGKLLLRRESSGMGGKGRYGSLAPESVLHLWGYNVNNDNGPDKEERQMIIAFIIDRKILTRYEIVEHLRWLIDTRSRQWEIYSDAIKSWENDVEITFNYNMDELTTYKNIELKWK
ncbi:MAG: hypothetical protein LBN30_02295 [Oscillospiraceae bacterium]|jgi:hypothetical protein|nr:hypothetical protein [Oscillospiraceae bacterium]